MDWVRRTIYLIALNLILIAAPGFQARTQTNDDVKADGKIQPFIKGGTLVTNPEEFPFQVAVIRVFANPDRFALCGGSLISELWVLTAAHCFFEGNVLRPDPVGTTRIRSGSLTWRSGGTLSLAAAVYIHPAYRGDQFENDVALVRLTAAVQASRFATLDRSNTATGNVDVTGWGVDETGSASPQLRKVTLPILSDTCSASGHFTVGTICAAPPGRSVCQGDSGGPWVRPGTAVLVGITSWESGGCTRYSGAMRVSHFAAWIDAITNPLLIHVLQSGQCLDADAKVQVWRCNSRDKQAWSVDKNARGLEADQVRIINGATDACLDGRIGNGDNGSDMKLYPCADDARSQRWTMKFNGTFVNVASGKCLDADTATLGDDGGRVQLYDCDDRAAQVWWYPGNSRRVRYENMRNKNCLDADTGTEGKNGTRVQTWPCDPATRGQIWIRTDSGYIVSSKSYRCLDSDQKEGSRKVQLWGCVARANQRWFEHPFPNKFKNESGGCLEAEVGSISDPSTLVQVGTCWNTANQTWLTRRLEQ